MSNATHFIEVVKYDNGATNTLTPQPIKLLKWALEISLKHGIETIAIFKISL